MGGINTVRVRCVVDPECCGYEQQIEGTNETQRELTKGEATILQVTTDEELRSGRGFKAKGLCRQRGMSVLR